jgi:hypothetical protein
MKLRNILLAGAYLAGTLLGIGSARAAEVIFDGTGFLQGQQSFTDAFSVSGPGTLSVTLDNVSWPEQLSSLNLVLGTANGLLGPEMGAGSESFKINSGGKVFAQWFGTAQGPMDVGVYSMKIMFTPAGQLAVPLPASAALLASGLALLVWQRRHRTRFQLLPRVSV